MAKDRREYFRKYYETNKERIQQYYKANKEKVLKRVNGTRPL